jgi:hypothetical protein
MAHDDDTRRADRLLCGGSIVLALDIPVVTLDELKRRLAA